MRELEKEAKARIKINKLLEEADWRLLDEKHGKANVLLENHVKLTSQDLDAWGEDFERTRDGFIDFLLLDANGYPFVALEAKAENETLPPIITRAIDGKFSPKINTRLSGVKIVENLNPWNLKNKNPVLFLAPYHMGDLHQVIIHHVGQVIGRHAVGFIQDLIVKCIGVDLYILS